MFNELHEECGVFGVYSRDGLDVASLCYYGLYALQHRGQESCGIAINDDGVIHCHKGAGLVSEIFTPEALHSLGSGQMAVAHVRYGTMGTDPRLNAQPLVVNHIKGRMALAHNGALTNAAELRSSLRWRAPSSTPPRIPRLSPTPSPASASPRIPSKKPSAGR